MNETIHFSLKREKEVYDLVADSLDGHPNGGPCTTGNLLGDNREEYAYILFTSEEILGLFHGILRASGHIHGGVAQLSERELSTIKEKINHEMGITELYRPEFLRLSLNALFESIRIFRSSENNNPEGFEDSPSLTTPLLKIKHKFDELKTQFIQHRDSKRFFESVLSMIESLTSCVGYINRATNVFFTDPRWSERKVLVDYEDVYLSEKERRLRAPQNNLEIYGTVYGPVSNGPMTNSGSISADVDAKSDDATESIELAREGNRISTKGLRISTRSLWVAVITLIVTVIGAIGWFSN